jgi:protein required for attachment to host cells
MNLRGAIAQDKRLSALYASDSSALRLWIVVASRDHARIFRKHSNGLSEIGETDMSEGVRIRNNDAEPTRHFIPPGIADPPYEPAMKAARRRAFLFAYEMSAWLNLALEHEAYDRLMIIAPPQTLADMRRFLGKAAYSRVVAEINRDLTRMGEDNMLEDLENNNFF